MALNWGLGHMCRMIPVIHELQRQGFEVIAGTSAEQKSILKHELPLVQCEDFPHVNVSLRGNRTQIFSIICQLPAFIRQIIREHQALKKIIRLYQPRVVISDNCYGLWNKNAYSIFITHQVNILLPPSLILMEKGINYMNRWFIRKFDECWVPDISAGDIAGKLSNNIRSINLNYIGVLSRFVQPNDKPGIQTGKKAILFILSGPEPQRTYFEKAIKRELADIPPGISYLIIRGKPNAVEEESPLSLHYADSQSLEKLMAEAQFVICRSGYSTIMDLLTLGKCALLIPTPGQTEQEYLASYMAKKGWFTTMKQHQFNITEGLRLLGSMNAEQQQTDLIIKSSQLLSTAVEKLSGKILS